MATTVRRALQAGRAALEAAGIEAAGREARLLLADVLGASQADLLREPDRTFEPAAFDAHLARRAGHEPLAFILGWQEFWSLRLAVSPATLIPRADSETLIEAAVSARPDIGSVLDLGTGTGCLLLAALSEYPGAWGVGIDRDPAAAALAQANARALGLADRCGIVCGHWASAIGSRFELVLANPPYVAHAAIAALMPEVARHEPGSALDGGPDGLDAYRAIVPVLPDLLTPGGLAVLELGIGQHDEVASLATAVGLIHVGARRDLAGIQRALLLSMA